ncbi:hypothetical protein A3218_19905 [Pseudomonas chlororaphis]|nr:hypothetical protein A3218_19905 [Pseudomonas chlororaphis]
MSSIFRIYLASTGLKSVLNEMVSLTEKPCRFTLAGLFSFSAGGSLMSTMHSLHMSGLGVISSIALVIRLL